MHFLFIVWRSLQRYCYAIAAVQVTNKFNEFMIPESSAGPAGSSLQ